MNGPLEPLMFWETPMSEIPAAELEEYERALDGEERRRVLGPGRMSVIDPLFFLPPWGVE